ncbi:helix-turn-helix transcriptional regulator [Glycomyces endophyticus]|uniref:Helix-turn-helix transcriptional regulator n=1 Tax=Glycomyces endophyticus TaxID=480996 RepID=A0ABP4SMI7_9ACTN
MADAKALRREIGREFDKMRDAARVPANEIRIIKICGSTRTFARLVKGERTNLTYPVIGALCDLFGASPQKKFEIQRLWDVLDNTSFSESAEAWLKDGFSPYLGFERIAVRLDLHEMSFVPGLFQTESYVRRLHDHNNRLEPTEAENLIELRLRRQQDMDDRGETVTIRALIQEGALRSGCDLEQLEHLCELDERPNITIAYLPFSAGPHPELIAPFNLLSFLNDKDPDLVYFEATGESRFVEALETVQACRRAFESGLGQARTIKEFRL